jgi:hypothetical protein
MEDKMQNYKIFLDLDGTLADFDRKVKEVMGQYPWEVDRKRMWKTLSRPELDFYASLDFMPDGRDLWEFCKLYNPVVLTGIPMGKWAPGQKKRWVGENLGWDVECITCFAKDKHLYGGPGTVLVDDRPEKSKDTWEQAGGVFITHTSAAESIRELQKLGF